MTTRAAWLDVAKRVLAGEAKGIRCPENNDDELSVRWVPAPDADEDGEYVLTCPGCGASNVILKNAGGS